MNDQTSPDEVPFSQDIHKLQDATAEQCIADLRRLVEANPERVISRNWYRVDGRYAESAWTQHFGTFHEFKRQANVTPSRHAARLEKAVAKHASTDSYKLINAAKSNYEGAYLRPSSL